MNTLRILCLLFAACTIAMADTHVIYVDQQGDDRADGAAAAPLASIEKALDLAASLSPTEEMPVMIKLGQGSFRAPSDEWQLNARHVYFRGNGADNTRIVADTVALTPETVTGFKELTIDGTLDIADHYLPVEGVKVISLKAVSGCLVGTHYDASGRLHSSTELPPGPASPSSNEYAPGRDRLFVAPDEDASNTFLLKAGDMMTGDLVMEAGRSIRGTGDPSSSVAISLLGNNLSGENGYGYFYGGNVGVAGGSIEGSSHDGVFSAGGAKVAGGSINGPQGNGSFQAGHATLEGGSIAGSLQYSDFTAGDVVIQGGVVSNLGEVMYVTMASGNVRIRGGWTAGPVSGGVPKGSVYISDVAPPALPGDAASKQYVDSATNTLAGGVKQYVDTATNDLGAATLRRSGDSMSSGHLTLANQPSADMHATTKGYVDLQASDAIATAIAYADSEFSAAMLAATYDTGNGIGNQNTVDHADYADAADHASSAAMADCAYYIDGATYDSDLGGYKITNMGDPDDPSDAATRNYVDTAMAQFETSAFLSRMSDSYEVSNCKDNYHQSVPEANGRYTPNGQTIEDCLVYTNANGFTIELSYFLEGAYMWLLTDGSEGFIDCQAWDQDHPVTGGWINGSCVIATIDAQGEVLQNLASPTSSSDAATKGYVDTKVFGESSIENDSVSTAKLQNESVTVAKLAPEVEARYVKRSGDTVTGNLTVQGELITQTLTVPNNWVVGSPTQAQDIALVNGALAIPASNNMAGTGATGTPVTGFVMPGTSYLVIITPRSEPTGHYWVSSRLTDSFTITTTGNAFQFDYLIIKQ